MSTLDKIASALEQVQDPELHRPITELGMVESVDFESGVVTIKVLLTISGCPMQDRLKSDVTAALQDIDEVQDVLLSSRVRLSGRGPTRQCQKDTS